MKTRKLWLGLSAAALASTASAPLSHHKAQASPSGLDAKTARTLASPLSIRVAGGHSHDAPKSDAKKPATAGPGGEGGEGGEGSAAQADADSRLDPLVRFYRDIQLVRGHLLVGGELVKAGLWPDALPHFLHPVEELYEKLEPHLGVLKIRGFKQQLGALAQTVKAKNATAYEAAVKALDARLANVDSAMKREVKEWTPFAVHVALETMRSAIGEYGESIENAKFTKAVEYQDSRGFVFQAERLLQSVEPELKAKYPADLATALESVAVLKSAWPAPLPPAAPILDVAAVTATVSKVELALGNVK